MELTYVEAARTITADRKPNAHREGRSAFHKCPTSAALGGRDNDIDLDIGAERVSHALADRSLRRRDRSFVAFVHCPALDALRPDKAGVGENAHVLAQGRSGNSELLGNQHAADAVLDQVSIDL